MAFDVSVSLRVEPSFKQRLAAQAEMDGCTLAAFIGRSVTEGILGGKEVVNARLDRHASGRLRMLAERNGSSIAELIGRIVTEEFAEASGS